MTDEIDTGLEPEDLPEAAAPEPQAPAWSDDDATEARAFGWKPQTEWQGERPAGYIESPVEYMDRVKRSKTFSAMSERIERQEREARETAQRMNAVNEFALKAQRDIYERRIAEIEVAKRRAAESGDVASYDRLTEARAQMDRQPPMAPVHAAPSSAVEEYRRANAWTENPLIWREAVDAVDFALKSGKSFTSEADQIKYAETLILQKYPHLAPKAAETAAPRPSRPAAVEGGGIAPASRSGGFASLPAEARAAFARFAREGIFSDDDAGRKAYMEAYNA